MAVDTRGGRSRGGRALVLLVAAWILSGELPQPDYRFAASQAQQFAWVRDDQPPLWDRIRGHVAEGRFELVGSAWVEPDCNVPSGESLRFVDPRTVLRFLRRQIAEGRTHGVERSLAPRARPRCSA